MKHLTDRLIRMFARDDRTAGMVIIEGALWASVVQFTNPFYQMFVSQMGGGDVAISLVNSMPALFALVVLLPLSGYIDTVPRKKPFVAKAILIYALLLPLMAMTPFMGRAKVPAFLVLIGLFNIPMLAYTVGWQSFFTDLFDEKRRVMPHAKREMMKNYIQGFTMCLGGFVLSYICSTGEQKILTYQIMFMIAFAMAVMQVRTLIKTDDSHVPDRPKRKMMGIKETLTMCVSELKKNKKFASFLGLLFTFYVSWQMAWPFFFIYLVGHLGHNEFFKNMLDFSSVILFGLTATFWGRYIEKNGAKKAGIIGYYTAAIMPVMLVTLNSTFWLWVNYIISGIFAAPLQLGMFNDMLDQLPEENRTFNIGIYNTVIQISGFISPLIGVSIYKATSIEFTMTLSSVLRVVAGTLFLVRYLKSRKTQSGYLG
ncbi:MAG: MFS transporter [Clostridia bacterium]|nr:MFS transporter [Clostridia bacterium]